MILCYSISISFWVVSITSLMRAFYYDVVDSFGDNRGYPSVVITIGTHCKSTGNVYEEVHIFLAIYGLSRLHNIYIMLAYHFFYLSAVTRLCFG